MMSGIQQALLEEIQTHAASLESVAERQNMLPRHKFALAIGHAAAILELAKIGLDKVQNG